MQRLLQSWPAKLVFEFSIQHFMVHRPGKPSHRACRRFIVITSLVTFRAVSCFCCRVPVFPFCCSADIFHAVGCSRCCTAVIIPSGRFLRCCSSDIFPRGRFLRCCSADTIPAVVFCCTAVVIPVAVFAHLIGPYHPVAVNLGGRAAYFFFIYL